MSKQNLIRRHAASKIRDFSDRLLAEGLACSRDMSHAPRGTPLYPPRRLASGGCARRQRRPHLDGEPHCRRRRRVCGRGEILTAAFAGWAAGAMSMAAGEFVSVSSQADLEAADLEREKR